MPIRMRRSVVAHPIRNVRLGGRPPDGRGLGQERDDRERRNPGAKDRGEAVGQKVVAGDDNRRGDRSQPAEPREMLEHISRADLAPRRLEEAEQDRGEDHDHHHGGGALPNEAHHSLGIPRRPELGRESALKEREEFVWNPRRPPSLRGGRRIPDDEAISRAWWRWPAGPGPNHRLPRSTWSGSGLSAAVQEIASSHPSRWAPRNDAGDEPSAAFDVTPIAP